MRHMHGGPDALYDLAIVQAAWWGDYWVGSRASGLAFRLAPNGVFSPDAVEEEVGVALGVRLGFGVGVEVHDLPLLRLVYRPVGEAGGVGVSGAGEVGPIGADLVGELAVFGTPDGLGAGVEGVEDVSDVVGVEGSEDGFVVFVAGGAEVEAVAVDGGAAGGRLGFEPAPSRVGDEAIACVIARGDEGFVVGACRVESQKFLGAVAEIGLGGCGEAGGRGVGFREEGLVADF